MIRNDKNSRTGSEFNCIKNLEALIFDSIVYLISFVIWKVAF